MESVSDSFFESFVKMRNFMVKSGKILPMKRLLRSIIISALSLWVIDVLIEGIWFDDTMSLIITAVVLGAMNAVVKPVLKVLSLPINLMTMGLFSFVLNGILLYVAIMVTNGHIDSFLTAMIASFLLAIVHSGLETILGGK